MGRVTGVLKKKLRGRKKNVKPLRKGNEPAAPKKKRYNTAAKSKGATPSQYLSIETRHNGEGEEGGGGRWSGIGSLLPPKRGM